VLAVEGNPALQIWEAHEDALGAYIRDSMLRTTSLPDPALLRNELLLAPQRLMRGLGKSLGDAGLPESTDHRPEVNTERFRWFGDPTNLCGFYNSLTIEQVVYGHPQPVLNLTPLTTARGL
jgi:hypothetical protein